MAGGPAFAIGRLYGRIEAAAARRPLTVLFAATAAVSLLFLRFPGIDIWASRSFFHAADRFALSAHPALAFLREIGSDLPIAVALVGLASILVKLARPGRPSLLPPRLAWFVFLPWLLSTILLVNGFMKPFWGRPRPRMVDLFGGDLPFAPAWTAGACTGNCSFVSGESSAAATLFALAVMAPPAWRRPLAIAVGLFVLAVSLNRVVFGGHFLSDVLLGWAASLAVIALLYRLFFRMRPAWLSNAALEARATRDGLALRRAIAGWWRRFKGGRAEAPPAP